MSANITDKITDVRNAARPTSARVATARTTGGANLACNALTGWPTASKVHFVTYQIDTSSNPIAGTQLDCSGIVSGNTLTSLTVIDGTDGGNSIGDVVEMLPTAAWGQDLADALTLEHNRTGTHKAAAATTIAATILSIIYPVGSIYTNASDGTNPATLLGFGTWAAFGAGRVPVGKAAAGTFSSAGGTGGEETHILTTAELAAHSHTINSQDFLYNGLGGGAVNFAGGGFTLNHGNATSDSTGSGTAHNNLQPYVVVYMWQRTA